MQERTNEQSGRMEKEKDPQPAELATQACNLQPAEPVKCAGCEGKPAPGNNPCAVCGKESEPVKVPSDAELEKAWDSFEAEMARHPTDDELEEFMAQFADEMGHIHDDQHAEAARALLARYTTTKEQP